MRHVSIGGVVAGTLAMLAATVLPADASGYRYWSYHHLAESGWEYSQTRMSSHVPDDGDVEAWRFVTGQLGDEDRIPRVEVTFDDICASTEPEDGHKRVGLVIDYGRPADSPADDDPPGAARVACAVVDDDATTAMALSSVAELRLDGESMCAVDGYPAAGCNEPVDRIPDDAAKPDEPLDADQVASLGSDASGTGDDESTGATTGTTDDTSAPSLGAWTSAGVAVVVVIAVGLLVRRTRNRQ